MGWNVFHPVPTTPAHVGTCAEPLPLRLRNELELGFKQVKWIEAIEFVESFANPGAGQGSYNEDHEFYGYRMAI
jgi:DMSO/TMAO reductase YedYZ molybdopterin-dependent catalytic subunit